MISRIDIEDMTDAQDEAKRTVPDTGWLIHKAGRGWYRPNAQGYTSDTSEAGRYSYADAMSYSHPKTAVYRKVPATRWNWLPVRTRMFLTGSRIAVRKLCGPKPPPLSPV